MLLSYDKNNPSEHNWNRTEGFMMLEWDMHNLLYYINHNERCKHVDLDNFDEGVDQFGFLERAIEATFN